MAFLHKKTNKKTLKSFKYLQKNNEPMNDPNVFKVFLMFFVVVVVDKGII